MSVTKNLTFRFFLRQNNKSDLNSERQYSVKMKNLIATFVIVLFSSITFAQAPKKFTTPSIGRLYGKVIDATSKQPLEFVSVALFTMKDSAITGTLTRANGDFSLENLPMGGFNLRITFIGFKKHEQKVFINMQSIEKDLGNIVLETDATLLNAVEIAEDKGSMSFTIDRKVYNVSKDLSAQGGTGLDAVKNIPSVSVDADGAVTLRNSSVQIFIDGRPTTLSLDQIPSDQIEKIEVISNPSVKFDANTVGGILNVVLKKNTKPGYNGTVMAGVGTGDRYNGMASLNIKEKRFNFSAMYNYNTGTNNAEGFTNRENLIFFVPEKQFNQNSLTRMKNVFQFGKIGVDYTINNRNLISINSNFMTGFHKSNETQNYKSFDAINAEVLHGDRFNDALTQHNNIGGQVLYKKSFPTVGKELTFDLNYNQSANNKNYLFSSYNYFPDGSSYANDPVLQKNDGGGSGKMMVFQSDFTNPINDSTKLELGVRFYYKTSKSRSFTDNYSYISNAYLEDTLLTNDYLINDMVNAAYVNFSSKTKWFGYQAGVRFEQSIYEGKLLNKPNESFGYNYPNSGNTLLNSLFPGIYLSKKIKTDQEIQLNFSRKINRPNFFQLMPYVMFADRYNYRIGNPSLTPEFVNMSELNYNLSNKKINYLVSVYGKITENPITNVTYQTPNDPNVLIATFKNGNNSVSYGLENTVKYTVFKPLSITANINVFYLNINYSDNNGTEFKNSGYSWTGKLTASYKLPLDFTFQVNGTYEAPKIIPQGKVIPMYFADVSLNKVIKKLLYLNLTLSDIANTKRMGANTTTSYYVQELMRRRETRFLRFSVTWMFGKQDASMFKKKSQRGDINQGGTSEGGDF